MRPLSLLLVLLLLAGVGFPALCYQESANVSNQSGTDTCLSSIYSGSYTCSGTWHLTNICQNVYDGDWSTPGGSKSSTNVTNAATLITVYKKPTGALPTSLIQTKLFTTVSNNSIPTSCWNYDTSEITFKFISYDTPADNGTFYCKNSSSDWVFVNKASSGRIMYEEGMYWNITEVVPFNVTINTPTNTTYYYPLITINTTCTGSGGSYLMNVTRNETNILNNQAVTNNTPYSFTSNFSTSNTWLLNVSCLNATTTNSSTVTFTTVMTNIPGVVLPSNSSYPSLSVPYSVNCSGSYDSYLMNVTFDGVVNVSNQAVTNNTNFNGTKAVTNGGHNITVTCENVTTNQSSGIFTAYEAPTVTLYTPLNGTTNLSSTITFGYSASSPNDATLNCSIYINGTLNQSNASYANGTTGQFLVLGFQNGTYPWAVRCYGSLGNYGDSETRTLIVAYDGGGGGGSVAEGEATEFIAAAVTMVGLLWFFAFLLHRAKNWLWGTVWLMACFLTAYIALAMMNRGFSNLLETTDLSDLTFAAVSILMYCVIIIFGWLLLSLMYHGLKALMDAASGKKRGDMEGLGGVD